MFNKMFRKINMDSIRNTVSYKSARIALSVIGVIVLSALIFHAGLSIGSHSRFRDRDDSRYEFQAPGGFSVRMPRGYIQEGHGVVGTVESVATSSLVLKSRDGAEQTVLLTDDTSVRNRFGDASSTAITVGDQAVVIGTPNEDGTVSASVIRVMSNKQTK